MGLHTPILKARAVKLVGPKVDCLAVGTVCERSGLHVSILCTAAGPRSLMPFPVRFVYLGPRKED